MTYRFALSPDDVSAVMGSLPVELRDPNSNGILYAEPDLIVPDKHIFAVQTAVTDLINGRKQYLIGLAVTERGKREQATFTSCGVPLIADERTISLLTMYRVIAEVNSGYSTLWIGSDGAVYPVDAGKLINMFHNVVGYIDECAQIYKDVREKINQGSITKFDQIMIEFKKPH